MVRFRILVLLLAVAGMASGALLGIGPWYNASVTMVPLVVLAYFAARSEHYTPDAPVYQAGAAELVRKWASRATLLGLALIVIPVLVMMFAFGLIIPMENIAKIPNWIRAAINMQIPYAGFVLLCAGFAVWSGAVFWKKKRDTEAGASSRAV
jgi:hypothetical protein